MLKRILCLNYALEVSGTLKIWKKKRLILDPPHGNAAFMGKENP
jgi:hypothetical protein